MLALMELFDKMEIPYSKPQMGDMIDPLGLTICNSTGLLGLQSKKVIKYLSAVRYVLLSKDGKVALGDIETLRGQLLYCTCIVKDGVTHNKPLHALVYIRSRFRNKT